MSKVIHIEVEHGDVVYVHRKHHWWTEQFDYTTAGFNKTDTFLSDVPPDVLCVWAQSGGPSSIEESDARPEPSGDEDDVEDL